MGIRIDKETLAKMTGEPVKKPSRRSKYNAKPTTYNGRRYDSMAEAKRAEQLEWLKRAGKVAWWLPQVPVMIGEPGVDGPYRIDFLVCEREADGTISVHGEDVKGMETASFRRHARQWMLRGPFPLHVIRQGTTDILPRGTEA